MRLYIDSATSRTVVVGGMPTAIFTKKQPATILSIFNMALSKNMNLLEAVTKKKLNCLRANIANKHRGSIFTYQRQVLNFDVLVNLQYIKSPSPGSFSPQSFRGDASLLSSKSPTPFQYRETPKTHEAVRTV